MNQPNPIHSLASSQHKPRPQHQLFNESFSLDEREGGPSENVSEDEYERHPEYHFVNQSEASIADRQSHFVPDLKGTCTSAFDSYGGEQSNPKLVACCENVDTEPQSGQQSTSLLLLLRPHSNNYKNPRSMFCSPTRVKYC